ncbi:uncharacterized protein BJX67DRAFT_351254 [Aspergillus lucknowensis]|uniref:NAD(P)-binding protein n=1 Tax=Aspergillus lucknowensis TaxID=176173 RepID=A0ABR4LUG7_9EURO
MASLHILPFSLNNPYALSLDKDSPFRVLARLLSTKCPPIAGIDLSSFAGKTILITGATGGCGLECAKAFARVGCRLILTARGREKAGAVVNEIEAAAASGEGQTRVDVLELDMASYESIRAFKERLERECQSLDLAVLNAGVYSTGFSKCPETDVEEVTQVNLLSTCAISLLTLPLLLNGPQQSRLLLISSEAHGWANPRQSSFPDLLKALNEPKSYKCYERYHISKLLLVLWTQELATRLDAGKVLVASASPGFTRTGLFRGFNTKTVASLIERVVCRTVEQGAAQNLMAITRMSGEVNGGFYSDGGFRGYVCSPIQMVGTILMQVT